MHSNAILHEAQQLHNASDRLDTLAEQHPLVSEALITISGSVRSTGNCVGGAGCDENSAARWSRPSKCLMCSLLSGSFICGIGVGR